MESSSHRRMVILPVFGDQRSDSAEYLLPYTSSHTGAVLLDACFAAFHMELLSLAPNLIHRVGICAKDFEDKVSLLCPTHDEYLCNPIVSSTRLLLIQALHYLYPVEGFQHPLTADLNGPFAEVLQTNSHCKVGILGFSLGILTATIVAASRSKIDFINRVVDAYRLAFWIGLRSRLYCSNIHIFSAQDFPPWAVEIISSDNTEVQQALLSFNKTTGSSVFITAVIDDNTLILSSHPDDLTALEPFLPPSTLINKTKVEALYHVPSRLHVVREEVLKDVKSRDIRFPTFEELLVPLRSSFTGELIEASSLEETLVTSVVDMILLQPVNWNMVIEKLTSSISSDLEINIFNVGTGKSAMKALENSLSLNSIIKVRSYDLVSDDVCPTGINVEEPVAIIGMSVNMPGAQSVDRLWDVLNRGMTTLEAIPADRFNVSDYITGQIPGRKLTAVTGNFVKNVGEFDNKFFNISPREAQSMDPQQRMLLHVAYEALEDAGYVPDSTPSFSEETFGCYIGAATHDYRHNLKDSIDVYYSTGTLGAFLSGRLSYCLDLSGPSIVVDTACSSSMVAVYQAVRALMNGDCNSALAGGANIISSPDMFLGLDKARFLSPSGGCKSFDASADGYSRSEGCGIFVLKRLSDAVKENDRILGIIRGVEVNQSGKAHSITRPHVPTQVKLIKRILERRGLDAHSINFVEAHGPGTQAGDVDELQSLRLSLAVARPPNNPLYIGSLKANIGHLEAVSGAASIAKVLLMLREKAIPAQISLKTLNPKIHALEIDNIIINTTNVPWKSVVEGKPRRALINNFGAAGSNTAIVIEEFIPTALEPRIRISSYVFGLSAKDSTALSRMRGNLIQWLKEHNQTSLADLSYTLLARRKVYPHRLVLTASTTEELISCLDRSTTLLVQKGEITSVVFVFTGHGSQYRGMGSSLYRSSPMFRKHINECDHILRAAGFHGILSVVTTETANELEGLEVNHTATFSLEYALSKVWISWGVMPVALLGHRQVIVDIYLFHRLISISLGEYVALVLAGSLSLRAALIVIATRARLMFGKCVLNATGMLSVALDHAKLQGILASSMRGSSLTISCYNSPQSCVISGPISELEVFKEFLDAEVASKCTWLDVPFAFHSPAMFPVLDDLLAIGNKIKTRPPLIPVISTVFGRVIMPGDRSFCAADYFAKHCASPVKFVDAVESYLTHPTLGKKGTMWLEIGPHPCLSPLLKSFPSISKSKVVASLHRKRDSWAALSTALASFYFADLVNWRAVFDQIGPVVLLSLPSYPFSHKKFWVAFEEPLTDATRLRPGFSFIRSWKKYPNAENGGIAVLDSPLSYLRPYIEGHRVGGLPLCPASVYIELVASSTTLALQHLNKCPQSLTLVFNHFTFTKPLTIKVDSREDATTLWIAVDTTEAAFTVKGPAILSSSRDEVIYAKGEYKLSDNGQVRDDFMRTLPLVDCYIEGVLSSTDHGEPERFSTCTIYDLIFPRIVEYSKEFRAIRSLSLSSDGMQAVARIRLDRDSQSGTFVFHPLFMDTLLQVPGFVANLRGGQSYAYICSEIACITVLPSLIDTAADYTIYSKHTKMSDSIIAESYAIREGHPRMVVATVKGIRFQCVRLSALESGTASKLPTSPSFNLAENTSLVRPLLESTVLAIVAKACKLDANAVTSYDDLDCLGVDSLMRLELCYDLNSTFPNLELHLQDISSCRNIQMIVEVVLRKNGTSTSVPQPNQPRSIAGIKRIVAHVLDINEESIIDDDDLSYLGLDSLSSIEVIHKLNTQLKIDLPSDFLSSKRTISDIGIQLASLNPCLDGKNEKLSTLTDRSKANSTKLQFALDLHRNIYLLQMTNPSNAPLVLIHDGSGLSVSYHRILNLARGVYCINNPKFVTSQPWSGIGEIAASYAESIVKDICGPVILGGWSFGGVVAFEIAKILRARSVDVKGIIFIDTPNPFTHAPLTLDLIDYVLDSAKDVDPEIRMLCRSQFVMTAQLLSEYAPTKSCGRLSAVFLRSEDGFNPPNIVDLPAWLVDRTDPSIITGGWNFLCGSPVTRIDIPGNHFQPFELKNVSAVSRSIAQACNILDV